MVVSKRCKICAVLDADNIPISGEYFGKLLPKLVERVCGVQVDERKIKGVMICLHCAIELVLTDVFIDKLRNSVKRLQKNAKETKPKTPSKDPNKKNGDNDKVNGAVSEVATTDANGETQYQNISNVIKAIEETLVSKTPKKVVRRKSVFPDKKNSNTPEENSDTLKFKKIPDNVPPTKASPKKDKKRKPESIAEPASPDAADNIDFKPIKQPKTSVSVADESLMDLTIDEQGLHSKNIKQPKVTNCVICGESFSKKTLLREHFDACHMGERLKECPHCSTEFRSQQKYDSHVFNEKCKNILHPCQNSRCNKHFKTIQKMELHMHEKHSPQNASDTE